MAQKETQMSLYQQIKADRMTAMKAGNKLAKDTLTTLVGEIQTALTRPKAKSEDDTALQVIKATVQNIEFNLTKYTDDAVIAEQKAAKDVLVKYLPTLMSDAQLESLIKAAIIEKGMNSQGAINQYFRSEHKGQYDGKRLNELFAQING